MSTCGVWDRPSPSSDSTSGAAVAARAAHLQPWLSRSALHLATMALTYFRVVQLLIAQFRRQRRKFPFCSAPCMYVTRHVSRLSGRDIDILRPSLQIHICRRGGTSDIWMHTSWASSEFSWFTLSLRDGRVFGVSSAGIDCQTSSKCDLAKGRVQSDFQK